MHIYNLQRRTTNNLCSIQYKSQRTCERKAYITKKLECIVCNDCISSPRYSFCLLHGTNIKRICSEKCKELFYMFPDYKSTRLGIPWYFVETVKYKQRR